MKKIIFSSGFIFFVTCCIFAQDSSVSENSDNPIVTALVIAVIVIAHICLTYAVYKMKGGIWACFYFFLAPVVLFLLMAYIGGINKSKKKDIHHYYH